MKRFFLWWMIIAGLTMLSAQEPAPPSPPVIDDPGTATDENRAAAVRGVVERAGHLSLRVDIELNSTVFHLISCGTGRRSSVELSSIKMIEFSRWRGKTLREHYYRFEPEEIVVTLDDDTTLCSLMTPGLRFFKTSQGTFYSYYFSGEYGAGVTDEPLHGTVTRVTFVKNRGGVPFLPFQLLR